MQRHESRSVYQCRKLSESTGDSAMSARCRRSTRSSCWRVKQICVVFLSVSLVCQRPAVVLASFSSVAEFNISAMLPEVNFTAWSASFQEALAVEATRTPGLSPSGPTLMAVGGVGPVLVYVCDVVKHNNISAFVVVGEQHLINTVLIATRHLGVPLLGYNIERPTVDIRVRLYVGNKVNVRLIVSVFRSKLLKYTLNSNMQAYVKSQPVHMFRCQALIYCVATC
jgi:hypothetical protein